MSTPNRASQLAAEIQSLGEARSCILALTKGAGVSELSSIIDTYKEATNLQLQMERELESYEERSRTHPDRKLIP